ncbi:permease [Cytobacillus firmus]|uniref:MFS transporter n=1 Tax=Cytobacillus firmus TaxID=1399 RepID=UPI00077C80CC|nr:MFS transporter [Cytobacillus firmus]MBG9542821.1 permease [Cytobacillus firmus]MBG9554296.1 permease [Cytobacillus firmus]MBG9557037.1 permease [Cytobacillus firmus]MBG9576543.1 permease [Cytobacillus firmus]MEC1891451.1 MFS transporter [Cytobacillus firmus]
MKIFNWKMASFLLTGIGISRLGDFIYLIAINSIVYDMTGSAAAVAGLWIIGPVTSVLTNSWSGGLIDRKNKKSIMIWTDLARAMGVALIPFLGSIGFIYAVLFLISMAKALFMPASATYIAKLVPIESRKRFNSINSFVTSGAFIVGPAIAGGLFLIGTIETAIYLNAASFVFSAVIIWVLPDMDKDLKSPSVQTSAYETLRDDWKQVIMFAGREVFIISVYGCFLAFGLFSLAMDSQEVVFIQDVVGLTEADYSFLVSISGIGFALGALFITIVSRMLSIKQLMGYGMLLTAAGYLIYALADSFMLVVMGFTVLGIFNAFSSAGYQTFYQNNVPVEIMGRMTSVIGVIQSFAQIILLFGIGVLGALFPLRYTIVILAVLNLILSLYVCRQLLKPGKQQYFSETTSS